MIWLLVLKGSFFICLVCVSLGWIKVGFYSKQFQKKSYVITYVVLSNYEKNLGIRYGLS